MEQSGVLQFSQQQVELLANTYQHVINIGPIILSYDINLSVPELIATVAVQLPFFGSKTIGSVDITPTNPSGSIGGSFHIITVKVDFSLDVATKVVSWTLTATISGHGITKSGTISI